MIHHVPVTALSAALIRADRATAEVAILRADLARARRVIARREDDLAAYRAAEAAWEADTARTRPSLWKKDR